MTSDKLDLERYLVRLDEPLHLSARGEWFHGGKPFTNRKVADLFTRSVVFDEQAGVWMVAIGPQRAEFTCEDTQIFVVELMDDGIAELSSCSFQPVGRDDFDLYVGRHNEWGLRSSRLPGEGRARLLPGLQQRLSDYVIEQPDGRLAVKMPSCIIELRYER